MASFNQAVNIPAPQDSIMVVKIKHSARGLADAPQIEWDDPILMKIVDITEQKFKEAIKEGITEAIKEALKELNERFDKFEAQFSIEFSCHQNPNSFITDPKITGLAL